MAKLALDLSQFKSAGVYTIEIDQSERIVVTTQSLRLVVGFSKIGPFNTPVFIRSTRDRQKYFGDIDLKLERKGSFFQRSIDTCLLQAPVFALNLLRANQSPDTSTNMDQVALTALSVDSNTSVQEDDLENIPMDLYINFFNRERFWKSDADYLQGVVQNKYGASNAESAPLLQLANVGTRDLSFIVRKAVGLQGYSVYAKEWYGADTNIPFEWIRPYDLMKDFFIQIFAVEGDWTKYNKLSTDPVFSQYFNANGLIPSKLTDFINLPQVNLVGSWTGTIIPEFRDQTGANQFIEDIVNASTPLTGVLLNVNHQALDQLIWDENDQQWEIGDGAAFDPAQYVVDLVGHNLIDYAGCVCPVQKSFLSYDIDVPDTVLHTELNISLVGSTGKIFTLDASADNTLITVGSLVKKDSTDSIPGVTRVIKKVYDSTLQTYKLETAEPIFDFYSDPSTIIVQKTIDDPEIATCYKMIKLEGLNINANHLPGYTDQGAPSIEEGVEKIYSMLEDKGILRGLTNPDMIQYRYVVDTMAYGLRPELGGKVYLSRLAKKRGKCTAIISAPSIAQFSTSQDPYFCDMFIPGVDPKPIFSTEWIPEGGNPDMPRAFTFSFPSEDNGARYCGIFGPYLKYVDNDKVFLVPPAADVSNTFVRKFLGGDPFAICANKNGIIANSNVGGVEYNLDQQDRDYLEPFGYNSIIERATSGQVMIYSNRTSFQTVRSDYNFLHVRELLNTIELQVEEVLKNFVFDYNNPVSRLNIVNSITPILESIKDAGALYDYEIVMDESNNTNELIDEGFAIIDIGVWINKGMEKIINRITVNKLGTASSGGFTAV